MNNLINQDEVPTTEALAEVGAKLTLQYNRIKRYVDDIFISRISDPMLKPYMLVFKPLNDRYDANSVDHKGLTSILTWSRKQYGSHTWLITKEKLHCAKIHFNLILFSSSHDFTERYHDKVFANKYKIYCKPVDDLKRCIEYVLKEALERPFEHYIDWDLKTRSVKREVPTFKVGSHNLTSGKLPNGKEYKNGYIVDVNNQPPKVDLEVADNLVIPHLAVSPPILGTSVALEPKSAQADLSAATE